MKMKQTLVVPDDNIKANFDRIYSMPDPREYYRVLHGLDYIIPDLAWPIFQQVTAKLKETRGRPIKVLDLGCSYGINAALLRYPVDMERLAQRYRDLQSAGLSSEEVIAYDRHYFNSWPKTNGIKTIGLDISKPAIAYAKSAGIIEDGFAEDLEASDPSEQLARALADVDLVISTGCVGYVSEKTFSRLMSCIRTPKPWFASFVLRLYPYSGIERVLQSRGLETEKLESVTFVQRRFHSETEYRDMISALRERGIETEGKEADGLLLAELFLSRLVGERDTLPIDRLVSITNGVRRVAGRRFQRHRDEVVRLVR